MQAATVHVSAINRRNWDTFWWRTMMVLGVLAGVHAIVFAFVPGYGSTSGHERMFAVPAIGIAHTVGGGIASIMGPFQFLGSLRRRSPRLHVWLGRIYLVCVAVSSIGGLYLSPGSLASNTFGIAFILLALAWLYTGVNAYITIRRRDVAAHRRWMIRNYALTYAAVTLRFHMPLLMLGGMNIVLALNVVGWTCWIPNLIFVEIWMRRRSARGYAPALA